MDPIAQQIKVIRSKLSLQPRQELIAYLENKIRELEIQNAPDYALHYSRKGVQDLRSAESEATLINTLIGWIAEANNQSDTDIRSVIAQIGAFMMSASYDKL